MFKRHTHDGPEAWAVPPWPRGTCDMADSRSKCNTLGNEQIGQLNDQGETVDQTVDRAVRT
jgi:hypothetical protein